jgi:hypothetical protein
MDVLRGRAFALRLWPASGLLVRALELSTSSPWGLATCRLAVQQLAAPQPPLKQRGGHSSSCHRTREQSSAAASPPVPDDRGPSFTLLSPQTIHPTSLAQQNMMRNVRADRAAAIAERRHAARATAADAKARRAADRAAAAATDAAASTAATAPQDVTVDRRAVQDAFVLLAIHGCSAPAPRCTRPTQCASAMIPAKPQTGAPATPMPARAAPKAFVSTPAPWAPRPPTITIAPTMTSAPAAAAVALESVTASAPAPALPMASALPAPESSPPVEAPELPALRNKPPGPKVVASPPKMLADDNEGTCLTLTLSYTPRYTCDVAAMAPAPVSPKPPATPVLSSSRRGTEPAPASSKAHPTTKKIASAAAQLAANVATAGCTLAAATVTATALSGVFTPLTVGMGMVAGGRCVWRALGQRRATRHAAAAACT